MFKKTKNKKHFLVLSYFFVFFLTVWPIFSLASGYPADLSVPAGGIFPGCGSSGCGFNDLLNLVNSIVHFALFKLAVPIVAIMLLYAGFLLISAGGSEEKRGKAKKIFFDAVIGLVIAAIAWILITFILSTLGYNGLNFFNGSNSSSDSNSSSEEQKKKDPPILFETVPVATPTSNTSPSYGFNSSETGEITYIGKCKSDTTYATEGENSITFKNLEPGDYSNCKITITNIEKVVSGPLAVSPFSISGNDTIFKGEGYDTENPTGTTCSDPSSEPISFNSREPSKIYWWQLKKVYAQTPSDGYSESKVFEDARILASNYREARCWLLNWYKERNIPNKALMSLYEGMKNQKKGMYYVANEPFKVIDGSKNPGVFEKYCGTNAWACSTNDHIVYLQYTGHNVDGSAAVFVHELEHVAEQNGGDIPSAESLVISGIIPPVNLETFLKAHGLEKDPRFFQNLYNFFYCYIYNGGSSNGDSCFDDTSYTEVIARIMATRFYYEMSPEYRTDLKFLKLNFNDYFTKTYLSSLPKLDSLNIGKYLYQQYYNDNLFQGLNELHTLTTASVWADIKDCHLINNKQKQKKYHCEFLDGTNKEYDSYEKAKDGIDALIVSRLSDLFNKTF